MKINSTDTISALKSGPKTENGVVFCPNCENGTLEDFYEVKSIPVHSVLLMPSRDHALGYPQRDLKLGFCPTCGFISNMVFDPTVHEYSTSCEESQGFSPTFNAFARSLAERWVEEYDLKGKTALEIGCGKGEFLAMMVESGMANGIGIDPAYIPERLNTPAADKLEFIQDLYDERYTELKADAVCCRHTLEHISPTSAFMRMVSQNIGDQTDTVLLFELPDVYRVLKEAAFWDIYYEHCSYFTKGSLARLFRQHGFRPVELDLEYDHQYITIAGYPDGGEPSSLIEGEDDLETVTAEVKRFKEKFRKLRNDWVSKIDAFKAEGKRTIVWGGGSKAVSFLTTLGLKDQIDFVVDINPHKHGKFIPGTGHEVRDPQTLRVEKPDCVILMNPVYEKEVSEQLAGMGLSPIILRV